VAKAAVVAEGGDGAEKATQKELALLASYRRLGVAPEGSEEWESKDIAEWARKSTRAGRARAAKIKAKRAQALQAGHRQQGSDAVSKSKKTRQKVVFSSAAQMGALLQAAEGAGCARGTLQALWDEASRDGGAGSSSSREGVG
jgi:hypothetical protein